MVDNWQIYLTDRKTVEKGKTDPEMGQKGVFLSKIGKKVQICIKITPFTY
jgi:hypothetical protein